MPSCPTIHKATWAICFLLPFAGNCFRGGFLRSHRDPQFSSSWPLTSLASRSLELRAHLDDHWEDAHHDYGQMYMDLMPNTPQANLPRVPNPNEQTTAIQPISQVQHDQFQQYSAHKDQEIENKKRQLYEHSDYYEYMHLRRSEHLRQLQLQIVDPHRKKFAVHVLQPRPDFKPSYAWADRHGLHSTSQWSNALEATNEKGRLLDAYLRRPVGYGSAYSWKERIGLHSTSVWSNALEATNEYGRELDAFLRQPAPYVPPYSWKERTGLHSDSVWSNALEATREYGRELDAFLRQPAEYEPPYSWRTRSGHVSGSVWSNALAATAEQGRQIKALQKANAHPREQRRAMLQASPPMPLPKDGAVIEALKEQMQNMQQSKGGSFDEDFARETFLSSSQPPTDPTFRKIEWPTPNSTPRKPQYTRRSVEINRANSQVASDRFHIPAQKTQPTSMIRPPANFPNETPTQSYSRMNANPQVPVSKHNTNPSQGMNTYYQARRNPPSSPAIHTKMSRPSTIVRKRGSPPPPSIPVSQRGGVQSTYMQDNARNTNQVETLGSHRPTTQISRWAQALSHSDMIGATMDSNKAETSSHGYARTNTPTGEYYDRAETHSQPSLDEIRNQIMGEAKGYIPPPRTD